MIRPAHPWSSRRIIRAFTAQRVSRLSIVPSGRAVRGVVARRSRPGRYPTVSAWPSRRSGERSARTLVARRVRTAPWRHPDPGHVRGSRGRRAGRPRSERPPPRKTVVSSSVRTSGWWSTSNPSMTQVPPRLDRFHLRPARVAGEVVDGTLDRLATLQRAQVRDESVPVERLGRVEVPSLTRRPVQVGEVPIVRIHREDDGVGKGLGHGVSEGRLAGPGAARDADQVGTAPSRHGATIPQALVGPARARARPAGAARGIGVPASGGGGFGAQPGGGAGVHVRAPAARRGASGSPRAAAWGSGRSPV